MSGCLAAGYWALRAVRRVQLLLRGEVAVSPAIPTSASFDNLESRANAILERLGSVPGGAAEAMTTFLQRRVVFMFGIASALWLMGAIDRVLCEFLCGQFWSTARRHATYCTSTFTSASALASRSSPKCALREARASALSAIGGGRHDRADRSVLQ